MPKLSEVFDQQSGRAGKAASPIEGGSMPIFTPGGQGVIEGPTNRPVGEAPSGAVDKNGNVIDTSGRVGDYVYSQGRAYVVPNSMTDLWQRYGVVRGSSAPQDFKLTDFANAAVDAFTAYMGLPTNTDNIINTVATGATSQLLKGSQATRGIWAVTNAMDSLLRAKNQYLKDWSDQEVDYDIALDFSTDENGDTIATVNYDKMKDAGYGSGRDVLKATNTENSDVSLVEDNNVRVDVSDAFARSDLYADTLKQIKDAYPILTTEMANTVVNEDTGATVLDTIKSFILSQEAQYYYNAKSIYDFKQVAPNASAESLQKATYTQLMGAMDQNTLKEMTVTVYNERNEIEEKNAEEYLNSIKAMDKKARENYMSSIGNRILSDDISDDEKAILQAQSNALYMASNNDGEYKDMYRKDFGDAVADSRTLLLGLRVGNLFGIDELTTFQENELYRAGLDVTTGLARVLASSKIMNGLEKLERMGIQQLGSKIGDNAVGNFLSNINEYAPQDTPFRITDIGKTTSNGAALTFGGWVGRTTTQQIAQLGADAMFDFTKMGAYAMAGEDYDFWDELSTDFLIDAMMTWGPNAYVEAMTAPKYERKWVKLSADEYKKEKKALEDIDKRMEEDEFFDGKYQGLTGEGMYELRYVEVTADELAKRHAERLQKLTDSKLGMKVQELFGDRNAALGKLALQVRKVVTGDTYYFRKMVNASNDIRQLTADTVNEYMSRDNTSKLFAEYKAALKDATRDGKMGEADRNYINAVLQRDRWLAMFKGDKKAEKDIRAEYDKYIENMAPERAEQLDRLITAMRPIAADGMDFYVERGILSKKQLRDMRNDPVYKDGKYFPVWKKGSPRGDIEIPQGRAKVKSIFDPKVLISVNDLESPIVTLGSYINNIARNVAMNDRNLTIREIASIPGIDIHITEDTGGALSDVTNLREVSEKFEKQYQKIVAEVKAAVPTRKQWQKINDELILKSASMKRAGELEALKTESKELKKQLKDLKAEQDKALEIAGQQEKLKELDDGIRALENDIREIDTTIMQLGSIDADFDLAALSYDERRQLAEDVARYNHDANGLSDYILLYRVQKGRPDGWHPNDHGVKGKFEALGGEEGLKGAVWLTADRKWAEGPDRATSGVKDATNENIVVIPVKRSDILDLGTEVNAKSELEKSGKKIVKTRGIDGGLKKSEYILWGNEHPEIFDDAWDAMLNQYADNQYRRSEAQRKRLERQKDRLTEQLNGLKNQREAFSRSVGPLTENDKKRVERRISQFNNFLKLNDNEINDKNVKKYAGDIAKAEELLQKIPDGEAKTSLKTLLDEVKQKMLEHGYEVLDLYGKETYTSSQDNAYESELIEGGVPFELLHLDNKDTPRGQSSYFVTEVISPAIKKNGELIQLPKVILGSKQDLEAKNRGQSVAYYNRFSMDEDASSKYVADLTPEPYTFHEAMESMFVGGSDNDRIMARIGRPDNIRISFDAALPKILQSSAGAAAFSDEIAAFNGDSRAAADGIYQRLLGTIESDSRVDKAVDTVDESLFADIVNDAADKIFSASQALVIEDWFNKQNAYMILKQRNAALDNWHKLQPLIQRLGIGGYTYAREDKYSPTTDEAYGVYRLFGVNDPYGYDDGTDFRQTDYDDGTVRLETMNPQNIVLSIRAFETLPAMKSTLVHEAAHAAFSKAANRVAILKDALRIIGVENAEVTDKIATSADATELIAYMTQKKYLSELAKRAEGKEHDEIIDHLMQDGVIQGHLDNIMNMLERPSVSFKRNFIEVIYDAITFIKAKVAGTLSLRDTNTFEEFYSGLISGRFASDMRVDTTGTPTVRIDGRERPELEFEWWRVSPDAEKMAIDLIELENKIDANKRAQLRAMDDIKTQAQKLMEKAQSINKGAPAKLDIQSYVDVQLTNNLKKAFKAKNTTAEIQAALNKAVEEANPYISRSQVIAARTEEAAYKFRKRAARDIKVKENVYGKKKADIVNDVIDKVTDFVVTKATGERATFKAIDDNELTRILNNHDDPHTISYLLNGVEHKMTLTGKGSEALVRELKSPEARTKTGLRRILNFGNKIAQAKRYLTTSSDPTRVLPNLARDWSRGIVTTGGNILLSPDKLRTDAIESGRYTPEQIEKIDNGFRLASQAIDESTFTASMQLPKKNREKAMVRALTADDGNAFTRFVYDRTENAGKFFSTLQDMGETFTRKRAMENAYYKELANASARGMDIDDAVKRATEAAYFYGREATVNFFRRGSLIAEIAQQVPYLSQNFASLESFKYAFLDNPIAVTRSLKATVSTYAALIAIALSNDESRKRYFLLTEYDRAHNIIIPLANDLIVTVPLDENVAAFLTPYRRMVETLNGVDPEAFYLWAAESLEALSPLDLSGFSEGDKFNVVRGFQKIGSQVIPTWAQPILESMTGTDWYYGSKISVDEDYVGSRTGNWNPAPGELTTKSKNSEILAHVANATGIPQWIVQNIYSEYGGNVGQYFLNTLDRLVGSTEEAQGGKSFMDAIFKPLTGADSDEANNAFWAGVNRLSDEKTTLQREIKTLNEKIEAAVGEEKAALQNKRQEKVRAFGTRVSDFLTQYLSAFELTGGLTKSQANRIWRLYDIYDLNENEQLYRSGSPEEYWSKKASKETSKEATNLAGLSGLDMYYRTPIDDYNRTYAEQMFRNTIYGEGTQRMAGIANILEDTSDYENSFTKLRSDAIKLRKEAKTDKDWDNYDRIAYQYDYKVLSAIYPYLVEHGVADTLNNNEVIKYLEDWILVPSSEMRTSKGRYVPNLGVDSEKYKAFTKQFVKKMYGVSGE